MAIGKACVQLYRRENGCQPKVIMKTIGLILLLLTGFSAAAQTSPAPACCRHPLRIFDNQTSVNLKPLFHWWTERTHTNSSPAEPDGSPAATRPLMAWQRVIGFKTAVIGSDWVVNAVVQSDPAGTNDIPQAIILKHPPAAEEAWYYELKRRLAAAAEQITADQHTYEAESLAAQKASAQAGNYDGTGKWPARVRAKNDQQAADRHRAAAAAALKDQKKLQAAYPKAQKELDALPAVNGRYQIDCFALELGRNTEGVRIFDFGALPAKSR